jgi:hypothetical protein
MFESKTGDVSTPIVVVGTPADSLCSIVKDFAAQT